MENFSFGTFEIVNILTFVVGMLANIATLRYFKGLSSRSDAARKEVPKTATLIIGQSFFSFDLIFLLTLGNRALIDLTTLDIIGFMTFCLIGAYGLVRCLLTDVQDRERMRTGLMAAGFGVSAACLLIALAYPVEYLMVHWLPLGVGVTLAFVLAALAMPHFRRGKTVTSFVVSMALLVVAATVFAMSVFGGVSAHLPASKAFIPSGLDLVRLQCLAVMSVVMVVSLSVLLGGNPRLHWRRYAVGVALVATLTVIIFVSTDRAMTASAKYFELARLIETLKSERLELRDTAMVHLAGSGDQTSQNALPPAFFSRLNSYNETIRGIDRLIADSGTSAEIRTLYFGPGPDADFVPVRKDFLAFADSIKHRLGLSFGYDGHAGFDGQNFDRRIAEFSATLVSTAKDSSRLQMLVKDMSLVGGFFIVAFMISGVLIPAHTSTIRALDELEAEKARVYKLALCAENTTKGVVLTDRKGTVTWCNDAFTEISGYPLSELMGRSLIRVLRHHGADMSVLGRHIDQLRKAQTSEIEILARKKDHSDVWLKGVVTPVEKDGDASQFVHVYEDVTESLAIRERLELARRQSERLALIARHASDGMAILDDKYQLVWMNPAMENLTGFIGDDLRNKPLSELFTGPLTDKREIKRITDRIASREPVTSELLLYPKSGSPHWVEAIHTPIFENDGRFSGYIIVHRNITERKNLELQLISHRDELAARVEERTQTIRNQSLELEKALDRERELNKMQTEFVSMASHEFRTPLTIIDGTARRLEKRSSRITPEDLTEKVQTIRSAVKRMTMLVERTLDASRLSSGRIRLTPEWFSLTRMVDEVVARQREVATTHDIKVDIEALPDQLFGDARLLDNVITNVLSNAVKYSGEARSISLSGYEEGGYAVIKVRDSGIGIPKDELSKIFQRFFRASTSAGIPGTGIGLNLVKSLVEMHYGSVDIDSEEGHWTEFIIRLPLESPLEDQMADTTDEGAVSDAA